jgi:hypothetical protein
MGTNIERSEEGETSCQDEGNDRKEDCDDKSHLQLDKLRSVCYKNVYVCVSEWVRTKEQKTAENGFFWVERILDSEQQSAALSTCRGSYT